MNQPGPKRLFKSEKEDLIVLSRRWRFLVLLATAFALFEACSDSGDHATHEGQTSTGQQSTEGIIPGESAPASEADRTIEVTASDDLAFTPEKLDVEAGEVVTFVISNEGKGEHEFVLGDEAYQEDHEEAMSSEEHHGSEDANAVTLPPGEVQELTWRFTESGEVQFACHVTGHYEGGMLGTISVQ